MAIMRVKIWLFLGLGLALGLWPACKPPQTEEKLSQEIQEIRKELSSLKDQMGRVEAGQPELQQMLAKLMAPKEPAALVVPGVDPGYILTVSQLFRERERWLGQRLKVKGEVGIVMMHRKSFYLKAPEGMVEVFFGNLPDKAMVDRLTSQALGRFATVTGVLAGATGHDPGRMQIMAEAVEF
jgi:hypothetical protein